MKDPYKRLSSEWGSKARKADSRAAKSTLKKLTREEKAEIKQGKIIAAIRERMANPPDICDRCGDDHNLFWNGNDWVCGACMEETQQ
jgi:hypothetical protein